MYKTNKFIDIISMVINMDERILNFDPKGTNEKIKRTYDINLESFEKIDYLSSHVYNAKMSEIVDAAIKYLVKHENITIRVVNKPEDFVRRSFSLTKEAVDGLERLNKKYPDFSVSKLVNIAISNALKQEEDHLANFKRD